MRIVELTAENTQAVAQAAQLLMEGFRNTGSTDWANLEDALLEIKEFFQPGCICRIAIDDAGNVLEAVINVQRSKATNFLRKRVAKATRCISFKVEASRS